MSETSTLPLKPGDRVVYPKQGLCTVVEIKPEEVAGHRLVFVSLVFAETGARVKVPQDKLLKIGVRLVATPEDVAEALDFLTSDSDKASLNWKLRKSDNATRMIEGGLVGLAQVVKELQVLSELRPLPPKEREQYNAARHLLVTEIAAAGGLLPADCEDLLDIVLFPVGRERPKRSIEEFQELAGDDDLGLDDLDSLAGGDTDAESDAEAESDGEEADEEAPKGGKGKKKGAAAAAAKRSLLSDIDVTEPLAAALPPPELKKKRGRPPKPKPDVPPEPKKRGRPPKPRAEAAPHKPKKPAAAPKAKKPAAAAKKKK